MMHGKPSRQVQTGIQVELLSRHFMRRWIQRLGKVPSVESVNLILRKGQVVKKGQSLFKLLRGRLYPYHTLTEVWNHNEGVLIWIDERRAAAVTVIVPHGTEKKDPAGLIDFQTWWVERCEKRKASAVKL